MIFKTHKHNNYLNPEVVTLLEVSLQPGGQGCVVSPRDHEPRVAAKIAFRGVALVTHVPHHQSAVG